MFTRCPACKTVFYITAAELKAAEGAVICGNCDTSFDALESLSETRPAADPPPAAEETSRAEEEDEDEPEAQAEFEVEPEVDEPARDEHEFLEEVESLIGSEEFDDDIPDPDSVFMIEDWPAESAPDAADNAEDDVKPADEATTPEVAGTVEDESTTEAETGQEPIPTLIAQTQADGPAPALSPVPADAQRDIEPQDSDPEADDFPGFDARRPARRRWWRIAMPAVAVFILVLAWAHSQRGQLLRHDTGQALLGTFYRIFGVDAVPDWDPGELIVLRSEAVADTGQPGNLRVAVEFRNAASFAQPYPVIRVVLQDRFGQRVGQRDVAPGDYLREAADPPRMEAGERVQATVSVPDPGARADGFRISLCLEMPPRGLVCTAEPLR
jgi:predicted Zn finger-like uncharacterized protein